MSERRARSSRLSLIGLRCAGKTSVGRALAELAGVPFCDLDDELLAHLQALARRRDDMADWSARAEAIRFASGHDAALTELVREGWERTGAPTA